MERGARSSRLSRYSRRPWPGSASKARGDSLQPPSDGWLTSEEAQVRRPLAQSKKSERRQTISGFSGTPNLLENVIYQLVPVECRWLTTRLIYLSRLCSFVARPWNPLLQVVPSFPLPAPHVCCLFLQGRPSWLLILWRLFFFPFLTYSTVCQFSCGGKCHLCRCSILHHRERVEMWVSP